jgi:1-phosphofructokinase family hexose kinase
VTQTSIVPAPPGESRAPVEVPIAVLTLNPSLDISYEVTQLIADQKTHADRARYDPGGNGINLARTLKTLGVRAETYCLVAGEIGRLVEQIAAPSLDALHCLHIPGETRVNCALVQAEPRIQYEVTADGAVVSGGALASIEAGFLYGAGTGLGVLTGSLPPGVPADVYARLVHRLREQGARAIVDARPEFLGTAIAARPFLIKPNRFELETLCGRRLPTCDDVAREARAVQQSGVPWVCISLGGEGAVLAGPGQTFEAVPPPVAIRSTVGAGDAMLAGLVAGFARGDPPATALRTAVACGSGTAEKPGTALCTAEDVARIFAGVVVRQLPDEHSATGQNAGTARDVGSRSRTA